MRSALLVGILTTMCAASCTNNGDTNSDTTSTSVPLVVDLATTCFPFADWATPPDVFPGGSWTTSAIVHAYGD